MKALKLFSIFLICLFYGSCSANAPTNSGERQTIIVTGATGELGGATARLLAQDYDLILTCRNVEKLKKLQTELKSSYSGRFEICAFDYLSNSSRENFKSYLKQLAVPISGMLLVTPRPQFYGKALLQDEKVWLEVLQSTFTAPMEALKITLPYLSNPSKVVVIAGVTSQQYFPEVGAPCVIRRMWIAYTKALSHQLGPQGISVNAISPSVVLTNFHEERIQKKAAEKGISYDEQMEKEVASIPLHRLAKPQEVAQTIKFLLSDQSDYITGVNLLLDGGSTVSY